MAPLSVARQLRKPQRSTENEASYCVRVCECASVRVCVRARVYLVQMNNLMRCVRGQRRCHIVWERQRSVTLRFISFLPTQPQPPPPLPPCYPLTRTMIIPGDLVPRPSLCARVLTCVCARACVLTLPWSTRERSGHGIAGSAAWAIGAGHVCMRGDGGTGVINILFGATTL